MTLSGPTRLLAAAGAVVALIVTAPAEAGGARASHGQARRRSVPPRSPWPRPRRRATTPPTDPVLAPRTTTG